MNGSSNRDIGVPIVDVPAVDVLIVGAGTTGLVLALWLARLGARVK